MARAGLMGVLLAALLIALPDQGAAQVVHGRVVLAGTEQPLADVLVRLHFPDGRQAATTVTDSAGGFRMRAPSLGSFSMSAELIGMAPVSTAQVRLNLSEEVEVELAMSEQPVPLDPLTVKGRAEIDIGFLAGYYERIERQQRLGIGHVLTRDRIEERAALDVADLLRELPGVHVVQGMRQVQSILFRGGARGECVPRVYLNGILQNRGGAAGDLAAVDETVRPYDLEGLEVYRGVSEMPAEYYDDTRCGVILLWTRRDADGGSPTTRRRLLFALAGGVAFVLLFMR
ncbi:MAG TPA: TonB-dependent receptor plug domain-containing protein [Longimicrobiales bacterium]|nr:TonB-dependent receptor plug domain-containing protein [Longimicrobiales bacterium]